MLYNATSELSSAIAAHKESKVLEWTIEYLQKEERNNVLVENIRKRNIVTADLIEYPLLKLERVTGLQNGETTVEPLPKWLTRVKEIKDAITKKNLPPPIIVTDFWQEMEIADGSHRHEALLQHGFTDYWTIFLFAHPQAAEKMRERLQKTG